MKQFDPGTIIIGFSRRVDRHGMSESDKYGNPMFHKPRPIYFQKHGGNQTKKVITVDDDGIERTSNRMIKNPDIPVFRGSDAITARRMRAQAKRDIRKMKEQKSKEATEDV